MGPPDDLKLGKLIGISGSGRVFASAGDRPSAAVKVFQEESISRALLEKMTAQLGRGGFPAGVVPVISADFRAPQAHWTTPLLADAGPDCGWQPRNLQMQLDDHPGLHSWKRVKSLARALAQMHGRRVPHGNLKPGNVFFSSDGEVLLSDWAMGNMPGIGQFSFTDAVLYQAPEQLRNPAGYLSGAGYRWDVFSFGVLAYRLLTGSFPRCHSTFTLVAPPAGVMRKEGIQANLEKIANNLEAQPHHSWPDAPQNPLEAGFRSWIDRCLSLDPAKRPGSMAEVVEGFEQLQSETDAASGRGMLAERCRRAERRNLVMFFLSGVAATAAVMLGALWHLTDERLLAERSGAEALVVALRVDAEKAIAAKAEAEAGMESAKAEAAKATQALGYERELSLARLEASRLIGDRLFAWAMEKGNRKLPPLDGRELRLKNLERYFEDFLTRTAAIDTLADERARVRLQLSEIALAAGDAAAASRRIQEALKAWKDQPIDAEMKLRMATNSLLLALLYQEAANPEAGPAFVSARKALEAIPLSEVDGDRLLQLLAILDFHEAKLLASRGDDPKALAQLMRATQTLNRIADQRPDAIILRSQLAACYLSSATILEGMGSMGDAREVRALAAAELEKLMEGNPGDYALRLDLAGCYGVMAESAVLSGDVSGADSLCRKSMDLLEKLLSEQPDNIEASWRKASQLGLRAGLQRDRGFLADAMQDNNEAIRMLEAIRASKPDHAMASYRLALVWWQKGRMQGMDGNRTEEISLLLKARDLLAELEVSRAVTGPRPEQLQSTGAYLLGDLGHALQLAGRKDDAIRIFTDAQALWESLLKSRPRSEEFSEGLDWCRQRLADLRQ